MEPPSTPPGAEHTGFLRGPRAAAGDERDKTRSPRPPGPGPTGQLVLGIYLWSSFCMYRSHFRLQIKSRDNQPGWTRTLQGRAGRQPQGRGTLDAGSAQAGNPLSPSRLPLEGLWGQQQDPHRRGGPCGKGKRAGVACFPVESHAAVCPSSPSPVQLHPGFLHLLFHIRSTS